MGDFLSIVHWQEIVYFLKQGTPPVGIQLLLANGVLMLVWIFRRMRGDHRFAERSGLALTAVLLLTNFYILAAGEGAFR